MQRHAIPIKELAFAPFAAWDTDWFLLTAGQYRPGPAPGVFNSMTVSWGGLGWIWGRPLAIVVVRPQRHTFRFMEAGDSFSLCAFPPAYHEVLNMLGTKSGRDGDKIKESGLTPIALSAIAAPGYAEAQLILECRKTYHDDIEPRHFLADFIAANYAARDYHRMYFGEVVAAQGTDAYHPRR